MRERKVNETEQQSTGGCPSTNPPSCNSTSRGPLKERRKEVAGLPNEVSGTLTGGNRREQAGTGGIAFVGGSGKEGGDGDGGTNGNGNDER